MWQPPGTHASSTFHAAHSPDAGLPQCPCPPSSIALCARIISQQRRRRRWSHPSEGSLPPSPSILYLSFSLTLCLFLSLSTLAAFILSRRGDTKRHLPGRDKPILEMPRGNLTLPASPSLHLSLPLSCSFSQGELCSAGLQAPLAPQWCVYSCVYVCLSFSGCVCALRRFKGFRLYSSPVNLIHGGRRRQGG